MTHACLLHLRYRQSDGVETHGLECGPYEQWTEEWWECGECGAKYTAEELAAREAGEER